MGIKNVGFLLLCLCVLTFISFPTSSTPVVCYDSGNFTANDTYGRNRELILSSLPSKIPENGGFYTAIVGEEPNRIYTLGLCRADSSSDVCSRCVNSTIAVIISTCPNQKEAISWGGDPPCIIHYANRSFFGILELSPTDSGYNVNNLTTNLTQFDQIWENLADGIVRRASSGTSRLKFAAGEAKLTSFQTIYALMQCTPDLSQGDCDLCLRQSVSDYQTCCHGKQGGFVQKPNCFFRWDLYPFYEYLSPPPSISPPDAIGNSTNTTTPKDNKDISTPTVIALVVSTIASIAIVAIACALLRRRRKPKLEIEGMDDSDGANGANSLQFNFATIMVATDNFSIKSKLGQGGFGAVYKGRLQDGQDIAVKRLSINSGQGELEFMNEVKLMSRLQHRNLVRLLGFCLDGNERLLIYEFVPNSSLDHFLFDPIKRLQLDWNTRYKIIGGIARGILYLHEDSRHRIIHRDLKVSNILLDAEMNPKISDFRMARLFLGDETEADTRNVVGTFGYMAPEYAMNGKFSVKSDVYSFGVLVLEIISGQKIYFSNGEEGESLVTYAWRNWMQGTTLNFVDSILRDGSRSEMMRCIQLGLLCVQENVARRPTMASVVLMLSSNSVSLEVPSKPSYVPLSVVESEASASAPAQFTVNEASISDLERR
ncbi:hypothetical protein SLE2022_015180 [Rubroshorea leprosula]